MTDKKQNKQLTQSDKADTTASSDSASKAPPKQSASPDTPSKASPPVTSKQAPREPASDNTEKTSTPAPSSDAPSQARERSAALKGIAVVLILLIILSIAGGVWLWQQIESLQQQQQQVSQQQLQLQRETNNAFAEVKGIQSDTASTARALSAQRDDLGQQQQRLQQLDLKINALSDRRPGDWLLAEANYLTTLAGRRLWLEHDVATSIRLLTAADQRIAQMHDPSLLNLRQALADDIATLRSLPQIDKEAMALQLNALQRQIPELPIAAIKLPESLDAPDPTVLSADPGDWRENLLQTWAAFADGFITVRERSGPVEPLMAPEQRWFLVENLKTKLLQAQLALYREQQLSWQDSLGQALSWTERFFDQDHQATQAMLAQLTDLSQRPIAPDYPADLTIRSLLEDALAERAGASTAAAPVVSEPLQAPVSETESPTADTAEPTPAPPTLMTPNESNTTEIETEAAPMFQVAPAPGDEQSVDELPAEELTQPEPQTEPQPELQPEPESEQEQQI